MGVKAGRYALLFMIDKLMSDFSLALNEHSDEVKQAQK